MMNNTPIADTAITATPDAIAHFKKHLVKNNAHMIRLSIVKAGCSGYRYEVTCVNENNALTENDKVFVLDPDVQLCVAKKIFPSVMGTVIDYCKKGLSGELAYNNPQQTGACGCGESFTID